MITSKLMTVNSHSEKLISGNVRAETGGVFYDSDTESLLRMTDKGTVQVKMIRFDELLERIKDMDDALPQLP